jgi:hypothetical protein
VLWILRWVYETKFIMTERFNSIIDIQWYIFHDIFVRSIMQVYWID